MKKLFTQIAAWSFIGYIISNIIYLPFNLNFLLSIAIVSTIIAFASDLLGLDKNKGGSTKTNTSNSGNKKLNQEVKEFFKQQQTYPLGNGIYLQYANVDSFDALNVLYNDEVICKVGEYRAFNSQTYEAIRIQFEKGINSVHEVNTNQKPEVHIQSAPAKSDIENYIDVLQGYTNGLDNTDVVSNLNKTSAMLKTIDTIVKKTPSKEAKLDKLKDFYLPSLITILKNYDYLCETNKNDQDFKKVEQKLISTIHLINEALQSIISSMNDEEIMDINSDMSVIETMLQQDGLVKKGSIDELK